MFVAQSVPAPDSSRRLRLCISATVEGPELCNRWLKQFELLISQFLLKIVAANTRICLLLSKLRHQESSP